MKLILAGGYLYYIQLILQNWFHEANISWWLHLLHPTDLKKWFHEASISWWLPLLHPTDLTKLVS
jgi:hypothetical protein